MTTDTGGSLPYIDYNFTPAVRKCITHIIQVPSELQPHTDIGGYTLDGSAMENLEGLKRANSSDRISCESGAGTQDAFYSRGRFGW